MFLFKYINKYLLFEIGFDVVNVTSLAHASINPHKMTAASTQNAIDVDDNCG